MKESVFSALSLLVTAGFLVACTTDHPGLSGMVSGVTSIGDGKVAVSRNTAKADSFGQIKAGVNLPPFVIDCSRERSSYC